MLAGHDRDEDSIASLTPSSQFSIYSGSDVEIRDLSASNSPHPGHRTSLPIHRILRLQNASSKSAQTRDTFLTSKVGQFLHLQTPLTQRRILVRLRSSTNGDAEEMTIRVTSNQML